MVDTGQMRREDTQFRLSQIAAAQKARGPHFALTNALPTRTNIISRKRDVVVFRLVLRDGHAETVASLLSDCRHRPRFDGMYAMEPRVRRGLIA
jgi:hypothetical protein